jgi:hypothetical protein
LRVFVTGASGLVGAALCDALLERGDEVVALSRAARESSRPGETWVAGDVTSDGDWQGAVAGCDAVVHLAGESIGGGRWNAARKRRLVSSRIESAKVLVRAIASAEPRPCALISASATGYYGTRDEEVLTEESAPGQDFLATLCCDWEAAAREAAASGVRVACLRFAVVLSRHDGALANMLLPFRLGLGGPIGPKARWFPWVHQRDAVALALLALDREDIEGPLNVVAPGVARMGEFAATLGRVLRRPAFLPVPLFAVWFPLGEFARYVSPGQHVACERALEYGYAFEYPTLEAALRDCVGQ